MKGISVKGRSGSGQVSLKGGYSRARGRAYPSEHEEQKAFFEWITLKKRTVPELALCYAVPNGGLRDRATAGKLKAEGVIPGVPDISLDVPRGPYHGLRIEMKAMDGRLRPNQKAFHEVLEGVGYCVKVCYNSGQAIDTVEWYLGLGEVKTTAK